MCYGETYNKQLQIMKKGDKRNEKETVKSQICKDFDLGNEIDFLNTVYFNFLTEYGALHCVCLITFRMSHMESFMKRIAFNVANGASLLISAWEWGAMFHIKLTK